MNDMLNISKVLLKHWAKLIDYIMRCITDKFKYLRKLYYCISQYNNRMIDNKFTINK